jgi:uncharacterized protein
MNTLNRKSVQFVIKTSKFCNLRCCYCYEYSELNNHSTITQDQLDQIYTHIADYYRKLDQPVDIEFIWHGGEALLIPPDFYWKTFDKQHEIFGDLADYISNSVQTNLTILDQERIRLLSEGFDRVGVSLDLFGGLRINESGMDSQNKVLKNIDILRSNHIDFGCITVLTKLNMSRILDIMNFYKTLKISSVRFLPLSKGVFESQYQGYEITDEEIQATFQTLVDWLLSNQSTINIEPISSYIQKVIHYYTPDVKPYFYKKDEWESIYVVNTNGDLFSNDSDAYDRDSCYGNLFTTSLGEILASDTRQKLISDAQHRINNICQSCHFYGSCSGYSVAENPLIDNQDTFGCSIDKSILTFVERRLKEIGIINPVTNRVKSYLISPVQHTTLSKPLPLPPQDSNTGIKLYCYDSSSFPSRIQYSAGIGKALNFPLLGKNYIAAAYIPLNPWREPTPSEYESLCAPNLLADLSQWTVGSDIGIIRLSDEVISPLEEIFEDYGTRYHLSENNYRAHTTHPLWENALTQVRLELEKYSLQGLKPEILSLASAYPELWTVTQEKMNPFKKEFVGLHLDSWDKKPLRRRHLSRNRICINLGREDRHFLFIDLTQIQMFHKMNLSEPENIYSDYRGLHIGQKFMQMFPDYPVTKLRVAPGEAYIAPTDNIIHDATSMGKLFPDIALHITGYFGISAQQVAAQKILVGGRV